MPTIFSLRSIHPPIHGRRSCPHTKGTNNCSRIWPMVIQAEPDPTWLESRRLTTTGVKKMTIMLEAEALQIAAGTLPFAMDVRAIEDWTVDGSVQRNRTPA